MIRAIPVLLAVLSGCSPYPLIDEQPVTGVVAHMAKDFIDFEFTVAREGPDCPVVGGLPDARLNGHKPLINRKGGKDKVLEKEMGVIKCFSFLVAFGNLSDVAGEDLTLTMSTKDAPWVIKVGNQPLTPRTLSLVGDVDGRELGGKTVKLKLDPPAPSDPKAEAEIGNEYDSLIAMYDIGDPQFRMTGADVEIDVPEKAGIVGTLRFKHLWTPTITGCPPGITCTIDAKPLMVNVPRPPEATLHKP